ncbi:tetratricopeptide repeat-containing protein [Geovibrio ferrireducens]|uniref:tetratricopeptide repeat-containing protein n=1 Tax=Geovibrio ferrireducens TaxID=46201 RepID=UPI00224705BE|nr:tetratricopeptide repeat-containing protein [Geovibrio ferrireducens]
MDKFCFVIMGYGKKTDTYTGKVFDLDMTYTNIIKPAVEKAGLICVRGDEIQESGLIDRNMYALLIRADLVIADISTYNPNAIYELGVRHASRPYSTIILKEDQGCLAFDLSHNKIFSYKHLGDDIGASEAKRCQEELVALITSILTRCETDSPFFQFIPSLCHYVLPDEEFGKILSELAEREKHLFAIVEKAKIEMNQNNFVAAYKLWSKASEKAEDEAYFIQQHALARYKSEFPSKAGALQDALIIISKLKPDLTNDTETLGITGAIYKRLYLLHKDIAYLDKAISFYRRGYVVNKDYYTGENYATCLELKSMQVIDENEKIYCRFESRKIREELINLITSILQQDDYEQRSDLKWIYATYSYSLYSLDLEYKEYENKFFALSNTDWEKNTYIQTKTLLDNIREGTHGKSL